MSRRLSVQRVASRYIASGAPSAEHLFFDRPRAREMREFAESDALTNDIGVADAAIRSGDLAESARAIRNQVAEAPWTISEVMEMPGADEFGTLNRYVVETEQPVRSARRRGL